MARIETVARHLILTALAGSLILSPVAATAEPYRPQDEDERGLWMQTEEMERDIQTSEFLIRDEALNDYLQSVLCLTVGEAKCGEARIYLTRTPYFNASMAPNGMLQIWSGLLLRIQNEAQLAAVLAHEYAHYEERHSLRLFRNMKDKSNAASWLGFLPYGWIAQLGLGLSIFGFSREMEREADARSLDYLVAAGYDPMAAPDIWQRLNAEMDATADERKQKSRKNKNGGLLATHPTNDERIEKLTEQAAAHAKAEEGAQGTDYLGREAYQAALAPFWVELVDDQLKLNDFGATDYLLNSLAEYQGWTAPLLYARAELYRRRAKGDDLIKAAEYYRGALALGDEIAEVHRGLGLVLIKQGQKAEGQAELKIYLGAKPDAADAALIRMMAGGEGS